MVFIYKEFLPNCQSLTVINCAKGLNVIDIATLHCKRLFISSIWRSCTIQSQVGNHSNPPINTALHAGIGTFHYNHSLLPKVGNNVADKNNILFVRIVLNGVSVNIVLEGWSTIYKTERVLQFANVRIFIEPIWKITIIVGGNFMRWLGRKGTGQKVLAKVGRRK